MKHTLLLLGIAAVLLSGCTGGRTPGEAGKTEAPTPATHTATVPATVPAEEQTEGAVETGEKQDLLDLNRLGEGQFGFADMTGTRLITFEGETPSDHPTSYELAVGDSGTVLQIKYQLTQEADSEDNGRATMYNFDHMAGSVYAVTEGTAKPNETYFLIADANWAADSALSVDASVKGHPVDGQMAKTIETAKKRAVKNAEEVALIGEDMKLLLVEFEKQGNEMLASLVLQAGDELSFHDFPAQYDPNSVWRVDDQGVISAGNFDVLFAGLGENGPILAVTWIGFEGENSFILAQVEGTLKETDIQAGRYTVPV